MEIEYLLWALNFSRNNNVFFNKVPLEKYLWEQLFSAFFIRFLFQSLHFSVLLGWFSGFNFNLFIFCVCACVFMCLWVKKEVICLFCFPFLLVFCFFVYFFVCFLDCFAAVSILSFVCILFHFCVFLYIVVKSRYDRFARRLHIREILKSEFAHNFYRNSSDSFHFFQIVIVDRERGNLFGFIIHLTSGGIALILHL